MFGDSAHARRSVSLGILAIVLMLAMASWDGTNRVQGQVADGLRPPRDPGMLYVSPALPNLFDQGTAVPSDDASWRRIIASHVPLIGGRHYLLGILANPNLSVSKTKWYSRFKNQTEAVDWLQQNLHVAQVPETALIQLWIGGDIEPAEAAGIVEDLGNFYIEENRKLATDQLLDRVSRLVGLKTRWEAAIRNARNKSLEAARQLQVDGFGNPPGGGQMEQELMQLTTERIKMESEIDRAEANYRQAQATVQQGMTRAVEMMISNNWQVIQFRSQLFELETVARLIPTTLPSPDRRETLQRRLEELVAQERSRNTAAYLDQLENQISESMRVRDNLDKLIEKHRVDLAEMSARAAEYHASKDEEAGLRENLRSVQKQLDILNTATQQSEMNQIRWAMRPARG